MMAEYDSYYCLYRRSTNPFTGGANSNITLSHRYIMEDIVTKLAALIDEDHGEIIVCYQGVVPLQHPVPRNGAAGEVRQVLQAWQEPAFRTQVRS